MPSSSIKLELQDTWLIWVSRTNATVVQESSCVSIFSTVLWDICDFSHTDPQLKATAS